MKTLKPKSLFTVLTVISVAIAACSGDGSVGADGGAATGPCRGVSCSGVGVCDDSSGRAVCICSEGYHPDGLLNCVADADPCSSVKCDEWKQCVNGACLLSAGRCDTAADCTGDAPCGEDHTCQAYDPCRGIVCSGHGKCEAAGYGYASQIVCRCDDGYHAEGLACVEDATGPCKDVVCYEWEECSDGICVFKDGRCEAEMDCADPDLCDLGTHTCVSDPCTGVECEEWKECEAGGCVLSNDRCEADSACQSPEVCDTVAHLCVADPCVSVVCGNGGVCAVSNALAICLCPHAFKPEGQKCVPDDSLPSTNEAGGWCGIQWPDKAHPIRAVVGDPPVTVYGQIYIRGTTETHLDRPNFRAALGYTAEPISYPVPYHKITWVPAVYNNQCTTCGNNEEYMADFPTDEAGSFNYVFRFSTNSGASFWYCDATPNFIASAQNTPGKATITEPFASPLLLEGPPAVTADGYSFAVLYTGTTPLDLAKSSISLGGADVSQGVPYDAVAQRFSVSATGVAPGKYSYLFKVKDTSGKTLPYLFVPLWVEAQEFSWQDAFLYQVMNDRFLDGDAKNNAPTAGVDTDRNWQGGDFAGIAQKIDAGYFDALGVNALWLSNPVTNTQKSGKGMNDDFQYSAYHSYWPIATGWTDTNRLAGITTPIEPHFGTESELKAVVRKAHAKGIRVLVDFVGNHVHTDSPLWTQHKADGWFNTPDNPYVCGWDRPIECWFTPYLPDFDYTNEDALQMVMVHAVWLVQEFDIDGFRLDAVKHMVMDFTTTLRRRLKGEVSTTGLQFYMVGETFDGDRGKIAEYVGADKLDGQFDFPLYFNLRDAILSQSQGLDGLKGFVEGNDGWYQGRWSGALMSNFMGNHDVKRALTFAGGDYARIRMAQTFLLTSPAIPLIYQGDDIGMEGGDDPYNRKMMEFSGLDAGQAETLSHLQRLGTYRKKSRALRYGTRTTLESGATIWAYRMKDGADEVIVILNRGGQMSKTYSTPLSGTLADIVSGNPVAVSNGQVTVTVPAMGTAVVGAP
ncbi:MAG: hypothetical protein HY897_15440 [Deltaproteobacteria bacterium]|nr:hypothetical protein [Deltaproteobacteria bacterium]